MCDGWENVTAIELFPPVQLLLPVPEQYSIVQYLVKLPVLCYIRPDEAFSNDWGLGLHTA